MVSSRDFKLFKKGLSDNSSVMESLEAFDVLFESIENHKYISVNDFYLFTSHTLKQLDISVKDATTFDLSTVQIFPSIDRLVKYFRKVSYFKVQTFIAL